MTPVRIEATCPAAALADAAAEVMDDVPPVEDHGGWSAITVPGDAGRDLALALHAAGHDVNVLRAVTS